MKKLGVEIVPGVFIDSKKANPKSDEGFCSECEYFQVCSGIFFDVDTTLRDVCWKFVPTNHYPVNVKETLLKVRLYNKGRERED